LFSRNSLTAKQRSVIKKRKAAAEFAPSSKQRARYSSPSSDEPTEEPIALDDHIRPVCLVEAYNKTDFRNAAAEVAWVMLRIHCPDLKPWHAIENIHQPYPDDATDHGEAREEFLSHLGFCIVLAPAFRRVSMTISCSEDPTKKHMLGVCGTWIILRLAVR
jgi:hypothetical protein